MNVKIKKLDENAIIPSRATSGSAGLDLTAVKIGVEHAEDGVVVLVYDSCIAIEIPEGYVGLLFPRSSIYKKSITMTNCVGVIDSDYRGSIMAKFKLNTNTIPSLYKEGDKFAQLIIVPAPSIDIELAEELSETERGTNGYGSTDTKQAPQQTEESDPNMENAA